MNFTQESRDKERKPNNRWYVLAVLTYFYSLNIADRFSISSLIEPIRKELMLTDSGVAFLTGIALALFYVTVGIPVVPLTELEARLRLIARDRISSGELPCVVPPLRMWGGDGSGRICVVCDKAIGSDDVEYEVEETIEGKVKLMWFHIVCQSIWQLECARAAYLKKCEKG